MQIIPSFSSDSSYDFFGGMNNPLNRQDTNDFMRSMEEALSAVQSGDERNIDTATSSTENITDSTIDSQQPLVEGPYSRHTTDGITYTLEEVTFTKSELQDLRKNLLQEGAPIESLKEFDILVSQPDGASLAQVMASLLGTNKEINLDDSDIKNITSLLNKIDPAGDLASFAISFMQNNNPEGALNFIINSFAELDTGSGININHEEFLALAKGLGLNNSTINQITGLFAGNDSINVSSSQFANLMSPASAQFAEKANNRKKLDEALDKTLKLIIAKAKNRMEKEKAANSLQDRKVEQSKIMINKTVQKESRDTLEATLEAGHKVDTLLEEDINKHSAIINYNNDNKSDIIGKAGKEDNIHLLSHNNNSKNNNKKHDISNIDETNIQEPINENLDDLENTTLFDELKNNTNDEEVLLKEINAKKMNKEDLEKNIIKNNFKAEIVEQEDNTNDVILENLPLEPINTALNSENFNDDSVNEDTNIMNNFVAPLQAEKQVNNLLDKQEATINELNEDAIQNIERVIDSDTSMDSHTNSDQQKNSSMSNNKQWQEFLNKVEVEPKFQHQQTNAFNLINGENFSASELTQNANVQENMPSLSRHAMQQIEHGILSSLKQGGTRLDLQLHPQELGAISITLTIRNGEISAKIISEKQETVELLNKQAEMLRVKLEDQGIKVDKIEVQLENKNDEYNNQSWENLNQHNSWQEEDSRRNELNRLKHLANMRNDSINSNNNNLEQPVHNIEKTARYSDQRLHLVA